MSDTERVDPRIERTRRAVLDATVDLLASDGAAHVTIDGIAERSGVARSTIYRHWPDRADLFAEAFAVVCAFADVADVGSLVAELRQRARQIARGLTDEAWGRMLPSVVGGADHDPDLRAALARFSADRRSEVFAVLRRAAARGDISRGISGDISADVDVELTLERFFAPFFIRRMMIGEPVDDAFVEAQLRWVCDELGARYTPPR